ncbi:hypothetical protein [Flavobacterium sp. U410]
MKVITIILFSVFLPFVSCKSLNNCILNMQFERELDGPGPDLLTFQLMSENEDLDNISDEIEVVEINFDEKRMFKSSAFSLLKIEKGNYELKLSSPFFTLSGYNDDDEIYKIYNESDRLIIRLILNENDIIEFKKCY